MVAKVIVRIDLEIETETEVEIVQDCYLPHLEEIINEAFSCHKQFHS